MHAHLPQGRGGSAAARMLRHRRAMKERSDCWRGRDDPRPFVPGLPEHVGRYRGVGALNRAMSCCTRCELAPGRTQVVIGTGAARAAVMFVGEAPGRWEDEAGEPFVGAAGRLFERLLGEAGLTRGEVYVTNVVACRPPRNRTPKVTEVRAHTPWLEETLRLVAPRVVATLGRVALTWFVPKAKITQLNGVVQQVEWRERALTVLPLYHPAAALRARDLLPRLEEGFRALGEVVRALDPGGPVRSARSRASGGAASRNRRR